MSQERIHRVTEKEFGPELAGQRVGWVALTGFGNWPPEQVAFVHIVTATVDEGGASLEHEPRVRFGEESKAYWSDAAKGFIATAGISVVVDKHQDPEDQRQTGPYWSFDGRSVIRDSSEGRILRQAGAAHVDDEVLEEKRIWSEGRDEVIANLKTTMDESGFIDQYPEVYYTANMLLAHDRFRARSDLANVRQETTLLPDPDMGETTELELATAEELANYLRDAHEVDETTERNLTVFGNIPSEEIPQAFKSARKKIYDTEMQVRAIKQKLNTQIGIFLPVGCARTWPYMDASISPSDERAFGRELYALMNNDISSTQHELKNERSELEYRIKYANQGLDALRLLSKAEERHQTA